jgi:hypothetical protein
MSLHRRLGLPLIKIERGYFGSWTAIEAWARTKASS